MKKENNPRKQGRPFLDSAVVKTTQVSVRLDGATFKKLDHINKFARIGRAEILRRAINEFIAHVEKSGRMTTRADIPPYKRNAP